MQASLQTSSLESPSLDRSGPPLCTQCKTEPVTEGAWALCFACDRAALAEQARMRDERVAARVESESRASGVPPRALAFLNRVASNRTDVTADHVRLRELGRRLTGRSAEFSTLVITGSKGTGKTVVAAAIALDKIRADVEREERLDAEDEFEAPPTRILNQGIWRSPRARSGVRFATLGDVLLEIKETYSRSSELTERSVIDKYRCAGLLVLDDVGATDPSRHTTRVLFEIVNHRYNQTLPTILTTNYELHRLARFLTPLDETDGAERIIDRIRETAVCVTMGGQSLRRAVEFKSEVDR